jgi:hypothetical protein
MLTRGVDDKPIWDVWLSAYWMPALTAADELLVFDAIEAGPLTAEGLGQQLELNPFALKALLPLLAALGYLRADQGRYSLTETARLYLVHSSPLYWGHAFSIHRTGGLYKRAIAALKSRPVEAVGVLGESTRPVDGWESGELDAGMAKLLCAFMHSHSLPAALGLAADPRFAGVKRLLDVGGGSGCFSIALAEANPGLACTVMELPVMCELARPYIGASKAADRIDARPVDMFRQAWPEGYDAIFMSNILHDWPEATCVKLAALAHGALPSGGRIFLHEMLLADDGSGPLAAAGFAMQMLFGTKGRQYSAAEHAGFLEAAGFVDVKAAPAHGYFSLVTATKP